MQAIITEVAVARSPHQRRLRMGQLDHSRAAVKAMAVLQCMANVFHQAVDAGCRRWEDRSGISQPAAWVGLRPELFMARMVWPEIETLPLTG